MMQTTIDSMEKISSITVLMSDDMHQTVKRMHDMTIDIAELRDHMADFEDFFQPFRGYAHSGRYPDSVVQQGLPASCLTALAR
jgi:RND superfamily putative drug exporter